LVGKFKKRARKQCIMQEMMNKMDERGNARMSTLQNSGRTTGG
jgi:hypothetical protein